MTTPPLLIAPSLLSCDFARIGEEVLRAERAGADWLHVDVMDGHFVPNLTIGPPIVAAVARVAHVPLDVHLMIANPLAFARAYAQAGARVLTFHIEVCATPADARAVIAAFRREGVAEVGVALNPDTPLERVVPILDEVDLVLVMSVFPGFGGQKFMPDVLAKTRALRARGYRGHVEMDGGLNQSTASACAAAGANALVAGSALFGAPEMQTAITEMRASAERARKEMTHAS